MISLQKLLAKITTTISSLQTNKANLASPAFTGNPTATTQTAGNNSTRIATTAFVKTAVDNATANIGTFLTASNSSDVQIPTSTGTEITHIDLTAGVWVLLGKVRFTVNTSGVRRINLSPNSGASDINVQAWPVQGTSSSTDMQVMWITNLTGNATYYLNAYQNSGSQLTCASGIGYIRAVRIA